MRFLCLFLMSCSILIVGVGEGNSSEIEAIQQKLEKSIEIDMISGKRNQAWLEEKSGLAQEITNLKIRTEWLSFKNNKYEKYIENQKALISDLKEKRVKSQQLRMELEPWVDATVRQLEEDVASDLPFLEEERQSRFDFLNRTLDDFHVGLGEKLRKTLEALQVEAAYGKDIEKTDQVIVLEGRGTRVSVIRIGRLGMYYISGDQKKGGQWNKELDSWEAAGPELMQNLCDISAMIEKKRVTRLLDLPMGGVK